MMDASRGFQFDLLELMHECIFVFPLNITTVLDQCATTVVFSAGTKNRTGATCTSWQ